MTTYRPYSVDLAHSVTQPEDQTITPLGGGIPTLTADLIRALVGPDEADKGEVFVQIDRQVLDDLRHDLAQASTGALLPYWYPVVVRVDETGDRIIVITTGDRAQE